MSSSNGTGLQITAVHVVMAGGLEHDVQVRNPDFLRYDLERNKRGWADGREVPILYLTFCTWAALTREGRLEGMPWEVFSRDALELTPETATVDPTEPAVEAG